MEGAICGAENVTHLYSTHNLYTFQRPVLLAFMMCALIFTLFPHLDLLISELFYTNAKGFYLAQNPLLETIRHIIWGLILAVFGVSVLGLVYMPPFWPALYNVPRQTWLFICALYVLGPGLLANGILKAYWGRARPADTLPFGGDKQFTMPLTPTDQCAANCSFVSGEASGCAALLISMLLITQYDPSLARRKRLRLGILVLALLGGFFRIVKGAHFTSDVLFAFILMTAIAVVLSFLWRFLASKA